MSVSTKVIVAGTVMDVSGRSGEVTQQDGTKRKWSRKTATIFGTGPAFGGVVAEVSFSGESEGETPTVGEFVTLLAEVGVYRDDDSTNFVRYVEIPAGK